MKVHYLIALTLLIAPTGCKTTKPDEKKQQTAATRNMADPSADVSYQGFVNRLRKAVAARNMPLVASMMTSNFGYLLEPAEGFSGEGPGVFEYWDKKGLWDELELVLNERFVPKGRYMVAPPQFADEAGFQGYRAGITMVNGSWRFAYFVAG
jgi:hypothetical protein